MVKSFYEVLGKKTYFEKGKLIERWGRKATDLKGEPMVAELPKG